MDFLCYLSHALITAIREWRKEVRKEVTAQRDKSSNIHASNVGANRLGNAWRIGCHFLLKNGWNPIKKIPASWRKSRCVSTRDCSRGTTKSNPIGPRVRTTEPWRVQEETFGQDSDTRLRNGASARSQILPKVINRK